MKLARRLYRVSDEGMIAGVSAGLAEYLGIPTIVVRIIFVLLALAAVGIPLYFLLWMVTPKDPAEGYAGRRIGRGILFGLFIGISLLAGMGLFAVHAPVAPVVMPFVLGLGAGLFFLRRARQMDVLPEEVLPAKEYPQPEMPRHPAPRDEAKIAGVCLHVANLIGLDPVIVRVLAIIFTPITFPLLPIAYAIAAFAGFRIRGQIQGPSGR